VAAPRKNRKNSKTLILVVYLLLGVSCLVWLAAYTFYFREQPGAAYEPGGGLDELAKNLPPVAPGGRQSSPAAASEKSGPEMPRETYGVSSAGAQRESRPAAEAARPPEGAAAGQKPAVRAAESGRRPVKGKIAVILDDAGYRNDLLKAFLRFPGELTISVLPGLAGSAEAARMIRRAGKQMMLHLPMEPQRGENPGPDAILTAMDDETISRLTRKHIASLPGILGVNNHMGSLATENQRVMRLVLGIIKEQGLFFIDSRTTAHSAGPPLARELQLPCRERSVFLDNDQSEEAIRKYFEAGKQIAVQQGWAIMIGHVWCDRLAGLLPRLYAEALDEGYGFYSVSELFTGAGR
jgi:polysaccharide deacetylase 2 family uncharacterized protein YibQ